MLRYLMNCVFVRASRGKGDPLPVIEEEIVWKLRRLHALSRRGAPHRPPENPPDAAEEQRDHSRGRMMGILADRGPMSQTALAALLDIRPQSLSELAAKAECEGLIARTPSEEDRRQTIVSLTDAGRARVAAFREAHRRHAEEFLSPLDEEEKKTLRGLLDKISEGQEEERPDQNPEKSEQTEGGVA